MKALDYERLAKKAENRLFDDPRISQVNKDIVKDYLPDYHVGYATKQILLTHLRVFLQKTKDISQDMHNQNKMDEVFRELYKEKPGYFETIRKVSKKFCRRINDDELPKAVRKALKKFPKEENIRFLVTKNLLLWEDGLKMIAATNSVQLKCIIALQLDAGMRPSEIVNLDYESIERKKDFVVVKVEGGKTGSRDIVCWRCVPYVLKWKAEHPSKKDSSPLWVQEHNNEGKIKRYNYPAILKQVKAIAKLAGIKKNVDFYALRHSSCFLDKLENIPLDIAAARHGHSVKYFTEVYGKLDVDAIIKRIKKHNGKGEEEEKEAERNITCSKCQFVNVPRSDFCEQCNLPLSMKVALEAEKEKDTELQELKTQIQEMPDQIAAQILAKIVKNPGDLRKALKI